jgi:hypothetical protein
MKTTLAVGVSTLLTGCGMVGGFQPPQSTGGAQAAAAPSGGVSSKTYADAHVMASDKSVEAFDPDVRRVLDAIAGTSKAPSGEPYEQASVVLAKLQKENIATRVDVPERGFPTVKNPLLEELAAASKDTSPRGRKRQQATGEKMARVQPTINALNAHLFAIYMAYNNTQVTSQLAGAWPLALAVGLENLARQGVLHEDLATRKRELRRALAASRLVQTQAATVMGLYAEYQAAVAGAVAPGALDDAVKAARGSLDTPPAIADAEVDALMQLATSSVDAVERAQPNTLKSLAKEGPVAVGQGGGATPLTSLISADRVTSVIGLLGAVASGNPLRILQNAAALVPEDHPLGAAIVGVAAISKGDFKKALDAASKVAPGTSIGQAISAANSVTKSVDAAVSSVRDAVPSSPVARPR